ncbi:alpha/beta hydrolase-fold protein [Chitinibacter sp. S2-10]|uniref:alpha/beta hydrolase-fold protein n=1 Tax=Chitinibacter sp. S2-10 TaxID=3373597 RepID=UPI003977BCEA
MNVMQQTLIATLLGLCSTAALAATATADCADYWRGDRAYTVDNTVSEQGRNYRAKWWTQAVRPGSQPYDSEWQDLGACQYPQVSSWTLDAATVKTLQSPSTTIGRDFIVEVHLPTGYQPQRTYPVLYVTDWNLLNEPAQTQTLFAWFEGREVPIEQIPSFISQYRAAEAEGKVAPVIIAGIRCPEELLNCLIRRERDFTPTFREDEDAYVRNFLPDLSADQQVTGGAAAYTRFLSEQVIPAVEQRFRAQPAKRGFVGASFGGLYGAHLQLNSPGLFSNYLLFSPALWYNDNATLNQANTVAQSALQASRRSYLSAGSEAGDFNLALTAAYADTLNGRQSDAHFVEFPSATHLEVPLVSTRPGLELLYPYGE